MAFYYQRIPPDPALLRGYFFLLDAIRDYTAKGRLADAAAHRKILAEMWAEFEKLGVQAAAKADEAIRLHIRQTQVRPDASGRLNKSIQSRPLPSSFPVGAVGFADIDELDKGTINPTAPTKGAYWRAQEYGTAAHVGRIVPGYFSFGGGPGRVGAVGHRVPHASLFRAGVPHARNPGHGHQTAVGSAPLPPRGVKVAVAFHTAREAAIVDRAIAALRLV
jgi:hypothetical protein